MGWWDCGIMGGDTPLDILHDLSDILVVPEDEPDSTRLYPLEHWSDERANGIAAALKSKWDEVEKMLKEYESDYSNAGVIAVQVVATVIMASGGSFPTGFKAKARTAGRNDEWANEEGDGGRKTRINEYMQAITDYKTGNRVVLTSEGLFQKMAKIIGGKEND